MCAIGLGDRLHSKGKGHPQDCGENCDMSLLSLVGQMYAKVLINLVVESTERVIGEDQCDFRKDKNCSDQIFVAGQLCNKMTEKKVAVLALMNLEKAYDREAMWEVLEIYGVERDVFPGIKKFYEQFSSCVWVTGNVSGCFRVNNGLRQGCEISSCLFNIYIEGVVREAYERTQERGVKMIEQDRSELLFSRLLFADYTALVAESAEQHQCLVEFGTVCEGMNLRVKIKKKNKFMGMGKEGVSHPFMSSFKYLGSCFSKDGGP